jgi:hypothetical protein
MEFARRDPVEQEPCKVSLRSPDLGNNLQPPEAADQLVSIAEHLAPAQSLLRNRGRQVAGQESRHLAGGSRIVIHSRLQGCKRIAHRVSQGFFSH